jgi:hypothetical protein
MGLTINYMITVSNNEDKTFLLKTVDNVISPILHLLIPSLDEHIAIGQDTFIVDCITKDLDNLVINIIASHEGHDYGIIIRHLKENGFKQAGD